MKVLSISGYSKTGKTTTAENLIGALVKRGYRVRAIKDIHAERFQMDTPGSNTHRLMAAGSDMVVARGLQETDFLIPRKMDIPDIISSIDGCDFLVIEGAHDESLPRILTARNIEEIDERMDRYVFAVSGVISNDIEAYKGISCINALTDIDKLADAAQQYAMDWGKIKQIDRFNSKRNAVTKIQAHGRYFVQKEFAESSSLAKEIFVNSTLRKGGIAVCEIESVSANTVTYKYMEGPLLIDILEQGTFREFEQAVGLLAAWLKDFYFCLQKAMGAMWIHNDAQLRNFILDAGKIKVYGLDFEACGPGIIEKDIAELFLFIATYSPMLSGERLKQALCFLSYATGLHINMNVFFDCIKNVWEGISERRNYAHHVKIPESLLTEAKNILSGR